MIAGPLCQVDRFTSDPLDLVDPQSEPRREAREFRQDPRPQRDVITGLRRSRPEELDGPVDVFGLGDRSEPGEDLRTPDRVEDARTPSSKTVARGPSPASNAASASAMVRRRIAEGSSIGVAPRARSRSSSARSRCPRTLARAAALSSSTAKDSSGPSAAKAR
jgi:hypothetical protein